MDRTPPRRLRVEDFLSDGTCLYEVVGLDERYCVVQDCASGKILSLALRHLGSLYWPVVPRPE